MRAEDMLLTSVANNLSQLVSVQPLFAARQRFVRLPVRVRHRGGGKCVVIHVAGQHAVADVAQVSDGVDVLESAALYE